MWLTGLINFVDSVYRTELYRCIVHFILLSFATFICLIQLFSFFSASYSEIYFVAS